ncbi:MAG: ABC transporter permease [Marinisporobacter sp.]|nr:ABC transporter permease [Marinisporobacter sp.]
MGFIRILLQDFKLLLKDKNALLILVLMPTILIMILGTVFKSTFSMKLEPFTVAFYSDDKPIVLQGSDTLCLGNSFLEEVLKSKELEGVVNTKEVSSENTGKQLLNHNKVSAFIYFPKGFTQRYLDGEETIIHIFIDNKKSVQGSLVEEIVYSFNERLRIMQVSMKAMEKQSNVYGITGEDRRALIMGIRNKTYEEHQTIPNISGKVPPVSAMQYYAIAMVTMYALFTGQFLIQSMIEEKKNKTFYRIQSSPIGRVQYVIGKLMGIVIVMLLQMVTLICITHFLFRLRWGNIGYIIIITVAYAFAIAGITLVLGFIAKDDRAISNLSMPIIFIFSFLGGSFVKLDKMPTFISHLQGIIPNGRAFKAYLSVVQGTDFTQLLSHISILISIACVCVIVSLTIAWRKGWRDGSIIKNNNISNKATA